MQRLRGPSTTAFLLIVSAVVGCTVVGMIAAYVFQPADWTNPAPDFPRNLLTRAWIHWDAGWYAEIVQNGYWYNPGQQSPVAFFPAYPVIVSLLHAVGINRFAGGILVTVVCGVVGLVLFHRWATQLRGEPLATRATSLFILYPFAFYLYGVMYSDAVFLVLVVGAFYALERDRLWIAVLLGALATAARPVAPAVVLGLLARRFELRLSKGERIRLSDLMPVLAGLGLAAYMAFLWHRFGDPLAFVHVQSAPGWGQAPGFKSWFKVNLLTSLRDSPLRFGTLVSLAHGIVALSTLALAIPTWRRLSKGYALYILAVVGIPALSSKDFMGLGRYVLAAFPVFLTLAVLLEPRPKLRRAWLLASGVGLVVVTAAFAADRYVA